MNKKPSILDELAERISKLVPPGVKELGEDFEKNLKQLIQATFSKLELVTRKEFDAQARVLLKTREKLVSLEEKLGQLEKTLAARAKKK